MASADTALKPLLTHSPTHPLDSVETPVFLTANHAEKWLHSWGNPHIIVSKFYFCDVAE